MYWRDGRQETLSPEKRFSTRPTLDLNTEQGQSLPSTPARQGHHAVKFPQTAGPGHELILDCVPGELQFRILSNWGMLESKFLEMSVEPLPYF